MKESHPDGYYPDLKSGIDFQIIKLGGNGWSTGCSSLVLMLTGEKQGKYYVADVGGGGLRFVREYLDDPNDYPDHYLVAWARKLASEAKD